MKIKSIPFPAEATPLHQEAISIPKLATDLINDRLVPVTESPALASEKETTHMC